jgi:hypothetical protein
MPAPHGDEKKGLFTGSRRAKFKEPQDERKKPYLPQATLNEPRKGSSPTANKAVCTLAETDQTVDRGETSLG